MNDVEFEQKLKSELHQRADRVTPSADAWARIQEQAATDSRRSGWMLGLGLVGAAGAAVAIGVNVLDAPSTVVVGPDPAGSEAVIPTAAPTDAPTADGSSEPAEDDPRTFDWSQAMLPVAGAGASAEGIASVGDTVMVVGEDPGNRVPATWLSTDGGRTFEQISPEGPSEGAWQDVLAFQGRFVLVGQRLGQPVIDVYDPASGQWSPAYAGDGDGVLYAVTDGPNGPIATGEARTGQGRQGLVLALDGGDTWSPVTGQPGFVSQETVLYHATATSTGYVATGYGPVSQTDTWYSVDGRTWEHLNADGRGIRGQGGVVDALVGDPATGAFWAVEAGGAVSRSTDGRVWDVVSSLGAPADELGFRTASATLVDGDLLAFAGEGTFTTAYTVDARDLRSAGLTRIEGNSLTVGAGATVLDDGTVMVPLSGPDGLFVWRGEPR